MIVRSASVIVMAFLSGCSALEEKQDDMSYAPVYQEVAPKRAQVSGSIFSASHELSLYEDIKAHRVGDIITVALVEDLSSKGKAKANFSKTSQTDLTNPTLLGSAVGIGSLGAAGGHFLANNKNLNLSASLEAGTRDFSGTIDSDQSTNLKGTITVTVAQVLPNGNLMVKGERWMTSSKGDEFVRVSGIIRPKDIGADNVVLSTRIADARIAYSGTGVFSNALKPGWLTRFFNSPLWPF